jgi:hypothetical protein
VKRLIEELPPGFEASLLRSEAEQPAPSEQARSRALEAAVQAMAAVGGSALIASEAAAAGAKAAGAGATGSTLPATTAAAPLLSKAWVISLAVGVAAAGTAGVVVYERSSAPPAVASAVPATPPSPNGLSIGLRGTTSGSELESLSKEAPSEPTAPLETTPVAPRPSVGAAKRGAERAPLVAPPAPSVIVPSNSPRADTQDGLAEEIAAIDRARSALAAHNPDEAIRVLNEHDRRFGQGSLSRESALLRVEALSARGDRAEAVRLAEELLAKNPDAPYRARLHKVLGQGAAP